ncbi:AAA family ATPase [Micromonospora sp. DT227]|uniref:AAA family ATPase n=1 Tax=Micromonospora sp. DT227 TaxID=3393433 RepID=UPI003CED7AEC
MPDPPPPVSADLPLSRAQEAWVEAQQLADLYRKARQQIDEELARVADRRDELDAEAKRIADANNAAADARKAVDAARAELDEDRRRYAEAERQLDDRRAELDRREKELNAQALEVEQGRLDAEAGYLEQERGHLHRLTEQRGQLLADLTAERHRLLADVERRHAEQEEQWRRRAAELDAARARTEVELEQRWGEADARERQVRERERQVRALEENQEEDRAYLQQRAELAVAVQLRQLELTRDRIARQYEVVEAHARDLQRQLDERNESLRLAGFESPELLHQRVRHLTEENERLMQRVATVPGAADPELLVQLQREHAECPGIRARLEFDNAKLRTEQNAYRIANTELEELREHRDALQHSVDRHKELLAQTQVELDKLVSSTHGVNPFPGLTELDDNPDLQQERRATDNSPDLTDLVAYAQQRILADETNRRGSTPLAYRARDIRCLLGGMAMSRLHILQGISGIGKTTFPKAFARAIGADFAVIEVQAGWRDRQDLIGHLNAFERRYYETAFTKAIYQAACPAHRNRPFFIILDEMNLAHPEQYFADVLSGLENVGSRFRLQLTSHQMEPRPRLLDVDKGIHLPIPDNVWFFGTSNHDETTVQFADKTYDRAHVIELPTTPPSLTPRKVPPREAISRRALVRSFGNAGRDHHDAQEQVVSFLREHLARTLAINFKIGWGPRLEQQVRDFAPVVVAAGGSPGEAADHILATRILRRLRGRYDLRPEKLQELRDLIDEGWPHLGATQVDGEDGPVTTRALLDELIEAGA